jgi:hypothetical protein
MSPSPTEPSKRVAPWLSFQHLWPFAVLAGIFILVSTFPIRPHDFWWHLKAGQEIAQSGHLPNLDTFSHTVSGQPYANYAAYWLMEVAYYLLYSAGGLALVILFHSLLVTGAYALLLRLCWLASRNWRVAAASTFFAAALGISNWNLRPQTIAFPAGVLVLSIIYEYRWRPRRWLLPIVPLTILLWSNGHGSFVVGLAMLGIWLADEAIGVVQNHSAEHGWARLDRLWPPVLTLLASGVACLINPRGARIALYVKDLTGNPVIRGFVPEWAPPTFAEWYGALFLIGLLFCAVVLALSPRRPSRFQIMMFVVFGILALRTTRSVVWFGIVMAPVLADHLVALYAGWSTTRPSRPPIRERPALNYLIAAVLCVGVLLGLPWFKHLLPLPVKKAGLISYETPVAATQALLREHPPGLIFNEQGFGSYLIWAAQPDYPVFVDTRLELYPLALWRDYADISAAREDWQARLDRYGIRTLMLSLAEQPALISAARASPEWRLLYEDDAAVIFTRAGAQES